METLKYCEHCLFTIFNIELTLMFSHIEFITGLAHTQSD